jgi:hypothetical protein
MSKWTHPICVECYVAREPGRAPIRVQDAPEETCCFCGKPTTDGIYCRADPTGLVCKHE